MCKRNGESRFCKDCCRGKPISITYSTCVSVALNYAAYKSSCAVFLSAAFPGLPYFSTLFYKRHNSRNKVTEYRKCFRVCKSVHHHTFNWINQPDASVSQVYYLSFKYSSTCFGHPHAHHQELNNCSNSLWFTVGTLLSPSSDGKPEAATAVVELLTMGMRIPETR
jgi:hypothetical protein